MIWLLLALGCAGDGSKETAADDSAPPAGPDRDEDGWPDDEDCAPDDPERHPGAAEDCDGVDDDCDGVVDDGFPATVYYRDGDGDGYGDEAHTLVSCVPEDGWTTDRSDCDDADPTVFPGAEEVCNDGVVQDCTGTLEEAAALCGLGGTLGPADARAAWTGEADEDLPGQAVAVAGDLLVVGAPGHRAAASNSGAVYLLSGSGAGGALGDVATAKVLGQAVGDAAGTAVAAVADLDGDGVAEVLLGAPGESTAANNAGAAYLLSAGATGEVDADAGLAVLRGGASNDRAGAAVAALDLGGAPAVAVGAYAADAGGLDGGAVYVWRRPLSGVVAVTSADLVLTGTAYAYAGYALADAGDTDGDGVSELLVGAPNDATGGVEAGAVFLVEPTGTGTQALSAAAIARFLGAAAGDRLGRASAGAGDVNGDGYADVVLGAAGADPGGSGSGAAWVLAGPFSGDRPVSGALLAVHGAAAGDEVGAAVASAGDLDGDGRDEVLVGAPGAGGVGALYYFRSATSGVVYGTGADAALVGEEAGGRLGAAALGGVDLDGDGLGDVLVGAPGADGVAFPGAVYRFAGEGP